MIIELNNENRQVTEMFTSASEPVLMHWFEPDLGLFIAESPKVIERGLDAGYEPFALMMNRRDIDGEAGDIVARCGDIPLYTADEDVIADMIGFKLIRGALCAMRRREHRAVEEVCKNARRIAVLENVVNPTNLGAIFRSAAALDMDAVLLTKGCTDPLYRRSLRVSMGTVFQVPWTYLNCDITEYPRYLRELGFSTAAMALRENTVDIDDERLNSEERLAVIMGTEGDGLLDSTIEACDYTVKIPMTHGVDSLNVAAASSVAFWQLGRSK